jgi:hypothetical protein
MRYWLAGVAAFVALAVLFPATLYIAIGALATFVVMALYIVCSGLTREGEWRAIEGDVHRRVHGIARRAGLIRKEAAHLIAVEDAKDDIRER